jgi:hypothetical protein
MEGESVAQVSCTHGRQRVSSPRLGESERGVPPLACPSRLRVAAEVPALACPSRLRVPKLYRLAMEVRVHCCMKTGAVRGTRDGPQLLRDGAAPEWRDRRLPTGCSRP